MEGKDNAYQLDRANMDNVHAEFKKRYGYLPAETRTLPNGTFVMRHSAKDNLYTFADADAPFSDHNNFFNFISI
jgi:hypothetical protein